METVSDNQGKRERGRPRKYGPEKYGYLDEFVRYESDPTRAIGAKEFFSVRQQQNIIHAERARDYLEEHMDDLGIEGFWGDWLIDVPQRVMTELGRCVPDEALLRECLKWYFEYGQRLTAAKAAKRIRDKRTA